MHITTGIEINHRSPRIIDKSSGKAQRLSNIAHSIVIIKYAAKYNKISIVTPKRIL